jgi:hypothetical protein
MNVKALKFLENVKTCWISMISFVKKIIARYNPFIMQMWENWLACEVTKVNITMLLNVQILLGFDYLIPLLELLMV